jgi:hypothetical protein
MSTTLAVFLAVGGAALALLAVLFGGGSTDGDGSSSDSSDSSDGGSGGGDGGD